MKQVYATRHQLICQGISLGRYYFPPVAPGVKLKIRSKSEGVYYEFGKQELTCTRETLVSECYITKTVSQYYIKDTVRDTYGLGLDDDSSYRAYQADYRTEKYRIYR